MGSKRLNHQAIENASHAVTQGGAAVATGSFFINYLNQNSSAILALCGIAGLLISFVGLGLQYYYLSKRDKREQSRMEYDE